MVEQIELKDSQSDRVVHQIFYQITEKWLLLGIGRCPPLRPLPSPSAWPSRSEQTDDTFLRPMPPQLFALQAVSFRSWHDALVQQRSAVAMSRQELRQGPEGLPRQEGVIHGGLVQGPQGTCLRRRHRMNPCRETSTATGKGSLWTTIPRLVSRRRARPRRTAPARIRQRRIARSASRGERRRQVLWRRPKRSIRRGEEGDENAGAANRRLREFRRGVWHTRDYRRRAGDGVLSRLPRQALGQCCCAIANPNSP